MTRITLVSSPALTEYQDLQDLQSLRERYLDSPPLGILVVASLFRKAGTEVSVVDSNRQYLQHLEQSLPQEQFTETLATALATHESDLFGFATICSSYYVTLDCARRLKEKRPDCTIVLGGPQATATAVETLERFPAVDFVLSGEVEDSVGPFIEGRDSAPSEVPGLFYRDDTGKVLQTTSLPPPDLDSTPWPAIDLWTDGNVSKLALEAGRGCPFDCKFCSTNSYFGRRYRVKSAERLIEEAAVLCERYGTNHVVMIHDHFAARKDEFAQFCRTWAADPRVQGIEWSCSLRIDAVNAQMTTTLAGAGCEGVFVGIETGSPRMQKLLRKRLNLERAKEAIDHLQDAGVKSAVSFIIGYPEETVEDLSATLDFYHYSLCRPLAAPQVVTLSPLKDSDYFDEFEEQLSFDGNFSGIAHQGGCLAPGAAEIVRSSPALFSAHHCLPLRHLERAEMLALAEFLKQGTNRYRWALAAAAACAGGLKNVFDLWWEQEKDNPELNESGFYAGPGFRRSMFRLLDRLPNTPDFAGEARSQFESVKSVYDKPLGSAEDIAEMKERAAALNDVTELSGDDELTACCLIRPLEFSFAQMISALREERPLASIPRHPCAIMLALSESGQVDIEEASELTACIVGRFRSPTAISGALERLSEESGDLLPDGVPPFEGMLVAVEQLVRRRLLAPTLRKR